MSVSFIVGLVLLVLLVLGLALLRERIERARRSAGVRMHGEWGGVPTGPPFPTSFELDQASGERSHRRDREG